MKTLMFIAMILIFPLPSHADVTSGLVAWWKFDDGSGTSATDSTGNGNTGTLTNGPTWTTGRKGGALYFDGTDDYVEVPYAGIDFERTEAFTISVWAIWEDYLPPGWWQAIIGRYIVLPGPVGRGTLFAHMKNADTYNNANSMGVWLMSGVAYSHIIVGTPTNSFPPDVWTHAVMTYDGSSTANGVKVYKNGVSQTLTVYFDSITSTIKTNTNWRIGDDYADDFLKGNMDDLRIYNRALTPDEVYNVYSSGLARAQINGQARLSNFKISPQ